MSNRRDLLEEVIWCLFTSKASVLNESGAGPGLGVVDGWGDERVARVTATDVVWVGIDAGKASHHAAAVGAGGERLWSVKVANGQQPIEELIARAVKTAVSAGGEVRWAVDLVS